MYGVELYAAVRLAVVDEGLSHHEAGRRFGIDRRTVKKMLSYSAPPGYRRTKPVQAAQAGWVHRHRRRDCPDRDRDLSPPKRRYPLSLGRPELHDDDLAIHPHDRRFSTVTEQVLEQRPPDLALRNVVLIRTPAVRSRPDQNLLQHLRPRRRKRSGTTDRTRQRRAQSIDHRPPTVGNLVDRSDSSDVDRAERSAVVVGGRRLKAMQALAGDHGRPGAFIRISDFDRPRKPLSVWEFLRFAVLIP